MAMKHGYFRLFRNESGFTLVELLIVIAIIGVLSAVIIPNVTSLTGSGKDEASRAEFVTLQTAMDAMMAKNGLSSVTVVKSATNNMAAFPDSKHPLYPTYLRSSTTSGTYTCDSSGLVTQAQNKITPTIKPTVTATPTTTRTTVSTVTKTAVPANTALQQTPAPTKTKKPENQ
jgi:prepilin-type N-terminal cleavage/methylation domain-containing protein